MCPSGSVEPLNSTPPLQCTSIYLDLHAQGLGAQAGFCASSVPQALASRETETSHYARGLPSLSPAQQENPVVARGYPMTGR